MESCLVEFLWVILLLVSVNLILIEGCGGLSIFKEGGREVWDEIDSSSDGMIWGDWGVGSGVIMDGRPEGVSRVLGLVDLGSI